MKPLAAAAPALLALALLAAPASAASFDCEKARTTVEKMVCGNARLSKLDELLAERYRWALSQTDDAKALRAEQRNWLKSARDVCYARSCLERAYRTRITEVTEIGCARAGTTEAPAVCAETELGKLEVLMGDRYARALAKGADPQALKAEQQNWTRDLRDACADRACLTAAHKDRIAALTKIGWMTNEKARAICEEIADAANELTLNRRYLSFLHGVSDEEKETWANVRPDSLYHLLGVLRVDYDADGKTETLAKIHTGGTCGYRALGDIAIGISWSPEGNWGRSLDEVLEIQGEFVVVSSGQAVSWIDPSGVPRTMCRIGRPADAEVESTTRITGINTAPCEELWRGKAKFLQKSTDIAISQEAYDGQFDDYQRRDSFGLSSENAVKGIVIDLDGDGDDEALAEIGWSSGAGCGSGDAWMVEIDRWSKSIVDSPLTGMPPSQFFQHERKSYIYRGPIVQRYEGGELVDQCRIDTYDTVSRGVVAFYPVESWEQ